MKLVKSPATEQGDETSDDQVVELLDDCFLHCETVPEKSCLKFLYPGSHLDIPSVSLVIRVTMSSQGTSVKVWARPAEASQIEMKNH